MKTLKSVAVILERELDSTIKEWLRQVKFVSDLTDIPLTDSDRTGHLPKLVGDVLYRLRLPRDAEPRISLPHPLTAQNDSHRATLSQC